MVTVAPNGVIIKYGGKVTELVMRPDGHINLQITRKMEEADSEDKPTCVCKIEDGTVKTITALSIEGASMLLVGLIRYLEFIDDFKPATFKP